MPRDKYFWRSLGYSSYREYLLSDDWKEVKERYRNSKLPQACVVCGSQNHELHRRRYGRKTICDLTPLCYEHHDELHRRGLSIASGHKTLRTTLKTQ